MKGALHRKLIWVLITLLGISGVLYIALTLYATQKYQQEVSQRLNQSLAEHIVNEKILMTDGGINQDAMEDIFHMMMVINPSIEFYLVDTKGALVAYSAKPGRVKRESIDLAPVKQFLSTPNQVFPLFGDDPRDPAGKKVFSAARVESDGALQGYLYVVLGGEEYDSVAQMLRVSYIVRLVAIVAAIVLLLTLLVGAWSFTHLTRRLRNLSDTVQKFRDSDFHEPVTIESLRRDEGGDEIDRLGLQFERMSNRIIEQFQQIKEADTSRREMIANISHDLKTPLASLQGYLETLIMKNDVLSDQQKSAHLETSLGHARRLGRLIEELFELATLEDRNASIQFEPFSLAELAQDVTQKFSNIAQQKGITLSADIPSDAPFVAGDIGLIERALDNLIDNALKFTPEGGNVTLSLISAGNSLVTTVQDSGLGIPEEELPHIFDRFYRVERHDSDSPEGTGLGLAITRRIMQLHGTDLVAKSAPGAGAQFSFPMNVISASS